jgi:protein TonB
MKSKKSLRRRLPLLLGGTFLLIVVVGVVILIKNFMENPDKPNTRRVQQISIIKPAEPPPPPPPEEKPPEVKEEVKLDEPPPPQQAEAAPPGNGMATSPDGDSSFGPGGGNGDVKLPDSSLYRQYLSGLQKTIRDELSRNGILRKGEYKAVVALWIAKNGSVEKFELLSSSGEPEVDAAMKKVLSLIKHFEEPRAEMPQPIKLRISSR